MPSLKSLSKEAIPAALEKAERYRLLNEPAEAESICLDILKADPENQSALITLLLALTDRFSKGYGVSDTQANQLLARITGEYERAYYAGILAERRAKAKLAQGHPGAGHYAYHELCEAMQQFEKAEKIRPSGNDDALLRWNTCARLMEKNKLAAREEDRSEPGARVSGAPVPDPQAADRDPAAVRSMFGRVARRYDLANHLLSGGLDFWWRHRASEIVRQWRPSRVLDLATGSGDLALAIARKLPEAKITGVDFSPRCWPLARGKGLADTVVADALQLPFAEASFDVVTVAFGLRNMADWGWPWRRWRGFSRRAVMFWCSIFRCRTAAGDRFIAPICTMFCPGWPGS